MFSCKVMPFSSKYPKLGKTKIMRLPHSCEHHFHMIADEYERIAQTKGIEFLDGMQRRLEDSLTNIG